MVCECIKKVEAKLRKDLGDPEANLKVEFAFVQKNGKAVVDEFIPVYVSYRKKKKDGTLNLKKTDMYIKGAYCPFCGKK